MKTRGSGVRFVAVSATVPNIDDVAHWIGSRYSNGAAATLQVFSRLFSRICFDCPNSSEKSIVPVSSHVLYTAFQEARTRTISCLRILWTFDCFHFFNSTLRTSRSWFSYQLERVITLDPTALHSLSLTRTIGVLSTAEQLMADYNKAVESKHMLPWSLPKRCFVLLCTEWKLIRFLESRGPFKASNSKVCCDASPSNRLLIASRHCRTRCSWHRRPSCWTGPVRQEACGGIVYEQGSACRSCNFGGFVCILVVDVAFWSPLDSCCWRESPWVTPWQWMFDLPNMFPSAAHIVVIKDVKLFQNGVSQEYSDLDIMQMIGRAVSWLHFVARVVSWNPFLD